MFNQKLKKAEGFILLQNNLKNAVFVKQAIPVGDVKHLLAITNRNKLYQNYLMSKWGGCNE